MPYLNIAYFVASTTRSEAYILAHNNIGRSYQLFCNLGYMNFEALFLVT
jgi:hypothetical protein